MVGSGAPALAADADAQITFLKTLDSQDSLVAVQLEWLATNEVRRCGNKRRLYLQWHACAQAR
jgi:hypothetical protein